PTAASSTVSTPSSSRSSSATTSQWRWFTDVMNDDWRLQIDFVDEGLADHLHDRLDAAELEHDLSRAFHDRVIVSRNGTTVFLYAGDREQAEKARDLVERLMRDEKEEVEVSFMRWHPEAEEWRPADEPLPDDAEAKAAE